MANKLKSFESVLDEERRDVLALLELEGPRSPVPSGTLRSEMDPRSPIQPVRSMLQFDSPLLSPRKTSINFSNGSSAPRVSPVRSMLDVDQSVAAIKNVHSSSDLNASSFLTTTYRSMLDVSPTNRNAFLPTDNVNPISPRPSPVRSMLDVTPISKSELLSPKNTYPASPRSTSSRSMPDSSPTRLNSPSSMEKVYNTNHAQVSRSQRASSLTSRSTSYYPRASFSVMPSAKPESAYELSGYLPSDTGGPYTPKRNAQTGKKTSVPSVVIDAVKGEFFCFKDPGKHVSSHKIGTAQSRSPHRFSLRSSTPKISEPTKTLFSDEGLVIPKKLPRRRLSDVNLGRASGVLSSRSATRRRTYSGCAALPSESRLEKEMLTAGAEEALETSDDSDSDSDIHQGRKNTHRSASEIERSIIPTEPEKKSCKGQGKLATIINQECLKPTASNPPLEESKSQPTFEPEASDVESSRDQLDQKRPQIHPNTSFDDDCSGYNTSHDSETEGSLSDIKRAQKLPIKITTVFSSPSSSRCVRSIHRGDFSKMQQEARDNQRRVRKYLVATDLSEEATHALEWAIGTVLRDGDTLLAIYCADEEAEIATNDSSSDDKTQDCVNPLPNSSKSPIPSPNPGYSQTQSQLGVAGASSTSNFADPNPSTREKIRAEQERRRAVQDITDRVSEFLRRTKLQVKVVIEVIHCKSPKHLITEVIDYVSPTLVILGSKGRSALKSVVLGSFSNYIVTKSSVPVMVARKRLRKHSKYKRPFIRLANNIENPHPTHESRILAAAKID